MKTAHLILLGVALIAGGAAWIFPPAGLVVAGVGLVGVGVLSEDDG